MIIHDPNVKGMAIRSGEDDTPLIVDPDRMVGGEIAFQLFEPIGRRHQQIVEPARRIKHFQLALGGSPKSLKLTHKPIAEQRFGLFVTKRFDHQ